MKGGKIVKRKKSLPFGVFIKRMFLDLSPFFFKSLYPMVNPPKIKQGWEAKWMSGNSD